MQSSSFRIRFSKELLIDMLNFRQLAFSHTIVVQIAYQVRFWCVVASIAFWNSRAWNLKPVLLRHFLLFARSFLLALWVERMHKPAQTCRKPKNIFGHWSHTRIVRLGKVKLSNFLPSRKGGIHRRSFSRGKFIFDRLNYLSVETWEAFAVSFVEWLRSDFKTSSWGGFSSSFNVYRLDSLSIHCPCSLE